MRVRPDCRRDLRSFIRRICPLSRSGPPPLSLGSIIRRFEEFGGRRTLARQRRLYRLNSSSSFGGVRTAPLSHIRPAPAALTSEEHTSELQSLMRISYAVFCFQKKPHDTPL